MGDRTPLAGVGDGNGQTGVAEDVNQARVEWPPKGGEIAQHNAEADEVETKPARRIPLLEQDLIVEGP